MGFDNGAVQMHLLGDIEHGYRTSNSALPSQRWSFDIGSNLLKQIDLCSIVARRHDRMVRDAMIMLFERDLLLMDDRVKWIVR